MHEERELKLILDKHRLGSRITGGQGRVAHGPNPLKEGEEEKGFPEAEVRMENFSDFSERASNFSDEIEIDEDDDDMNA